jgi:hypothetical protein
MIKNERLHAQVVHSALKKLRQEDGKFKVSLGNIVRPCLKKAKTGVAQTVKAPA